MGGHVYPDRMDVLLVEWRVEFLVKLKDLAWISVEESVESIQTIAKYSGFNRWARETLHFLVLSRPGKQAAISDQCE
jgi:hypothetical protein